MGHQPLHVALPLPGTLHMVGAAVGTSVGASVGASVGEGVGESVAGCGHQVASQVLQFASLSWHQPPNLAESTVHQSACHAPGQPHCLLKHWSTSVASSVGEGVVGGDGGRVGCGVGACVGLGGCVGCHVGLRVTLFVGAGVGGGVGPEATTLMSAQFQNSSPQSPAFPQQRFSHVAQSATLNALQEPASQPSSWMPLK